MTGTATLDPRRGRRGCLTLAAVFLVPLAGAFWLYYGAERWRPAGAANQGELIDPARPLPTLALVDADGTAFATDLLRGRWTMLYVGEGRCDARCRRVLYLTRQTRIALNKDSARVHRVFLATGPCCDRAYFAAEHPDLSVAVPTGEQLAAFTPQFPTHDGVPVTEAGRIYLVDPLGNLMMSYPAAAPDKALLIDLKRLLKLSHIG